VADQSLLLQVGQRRPTLLDLRFRDRPVDRCGDITVDIEPCTCATPYDPAGTGSDGLAA